jgi:hypothetical protein
MQLVGTGSLFAGSQALQLGERNVGASAGRTGPVSADTTSIDLSKLAFASIAAADYEPADVTLGGAGFMTNSSLTNNSIALNAANAGNGSVSISASTGGFFGQGTTFGATAAPTFANTGFFVKP